MLRSYNEVLHSNENNELPLHVTRKHLKNISERSEAQKEELPFIKKTKTENQKTKLFCLSMHVQLSTPYFFSFKWGMGKAVTTVNIGLMLPLQGRRRGVGCW